MVIRAKTFKDWLKANFDRSELRDIHERGADAGWGGLSYYSDTSALYNRFEEELWERLGELADDYGADGPVGWLNEYCKYGREAATPAQFKCAVVWVVAEHYAGQMVNR